MIEINFPDRTEANRTISPCGQVHAVLFHVWDMDSDRWTEPRESPPHQHSSHV